VGSFPGPTATLPGPITGGMPLTSPPGPLGGGTQPGPRKGRATIPPSDRPPKSAGVNMRLAEALIAALTAVTGQPSIPCQRLIHEILKRKPSRRRVRLPPERVPQPCLMPVSATRTAIPPHSRQGCA
jgi:hypothetical protein